jgi:hypothetical protein
MAQTSIDPTGYATGCPLRDKPLRPEAGPVDAFADKVLQRLRERDEMTAQRLYMGWLTPIEIARVAGEVAAGMVGLAAVEP